MRDIKVKEVKHNIKILDKKANSEYYEKKAEIKIKDKQNTKEKEEESSSSSPDHQAVDKVVKREKKTASESAFYTRKYTKNKRAILKVIKTKEFTKADKLTKDNDMNINTETIRHTTDTKLNARSISQNAVDKTTKVVDMKIKPHEIKQKNVVPRKRTISSKIQITNKGIKKKNYNQYMKQLGIKRKQKKIKEAKHKTSSVFRKSASVTGKSVKVVFKAVVKTISSIHNLISMGGALILLVVITLFIGVFASLSSDSTINTSMESISKEVFEYTDVIEKYAEKYDIKEYVTLIQAVMMQESGGNGTDPMQASESEYNTEFPNVPNGITNAEYSINIGIQYLANCLKLANVSSPTDIAGISLALQGYNYGNGYISWAKEHFNGYTRANAKVFSDEMKAKLQINAYGDPEYVPHVLRYYRIGSGKIADIALSQVGNVGGKIYWQWYGFNSRVEWCACFVSWCAEQAGLIEQGIVPKFSYCPMGIQLFKDKGQWLKRGSVPSTGDIIFFDWQNDGISDHVGIVVEVDGSIIYTVEGNSIGDECRYNSYPVNSIYIFGYGKIS